MIFLELGQTPAFPNGSAARSHVLRLPLDHDGRIDEQAYHDHAELATARRFWPNEPDRHGRLLRTDEGWMLAYTPAPDETERLFRMATHAIRPGSTLILTDAEGATLPFRVKTFGAG